MFAQVRDMNNASLTKRQPLCQQHSMETIQSRRIIPREFKPAILFSLDHALFTPWEWIMLNNFDLLNQSNCLKLQDQ